MTESVYNTSRTFPGRTWFPFPPILLFILLLMCSGAHRVIAQGEGDSSITVDEAVRVLKSNRPEVFPFQLSFHVRFHQEPALEDQTVRALASGLKNQGIRFTWLELGYRRDSEELLVRNREWYLSKNDLGYHHWWIEGSQSAFVNANRSGPGVLIRNPPFSSPSIALQRLLAAYMMVRLKPGVLDSTSLQANRTEEEQIRLLIRRKKKDPLVVTTLGITLNSKTGSITSLRLRRRRPDLYFYSNHQSARLELKGAAPENDTLPTRAQFYKNHEKIHSVKLGFQSSPEGLKRENAPLWYRQLHTSGEKQSDRFETCSTPPFEVVRNAGFFRRDAFLKRLRIHRHQVQKIKQCIASNGGSVIGRELLSSFQYAADSSYVPELPDSPETSIYRVFLRLRRLVQKQSIDKFSSPSTSVPSLYLPLIHLLAIRSSARDVETPSHLFKLLKRVSSEYNMQLSRLFVRELEHQIRGKNDRKGIVQSRGKKFLVTLRKRMHENPESRLLVARVFRFMGYFDRADKHYASLIGTRSVRREVHEFIRTARTKASRCLYRMGRNRLGLRELLYLAAVQTRNENAGSVAETLDTFFQRTQKGNGSVLREDFESIRDAFKLLLSSNHEKLVRQLMIRIMHRESGLVLSRSYFLPLVYRVFGRKSGGMYDLIRHTSVPMNVSPFMSLSEAVRFCLKRIPKGKPEKTDYRFLARAIRVLIHREKTVPDGTSEALQKGVEAHSGDPLLHERAADLMVRNDELKAAHRQYRKALIARGTLLESSSGTSEQLRSTPGAYLSVSDQLLNDETRTPDLDHPLVLKYVITAANDRNEESVSILNRYVDVYGSKASWSGLVRDPGVRADFERQFFAWSYYLLNQEKRARSVMEEGVRRERSRFPYGTVSKSATGGYLNLLEQLDLNEKQPEILLRVARWELQDKRPFRYPDRLGFEYVNRMKKEKKIQKALAYLRSASRREWRQTETFTYDSSATKARVRLLTKTEKHRAALRVLRYAFFRSLAEEPPGFEADTAARALVTRLEKAGRSAEALVVCRELSAHFTDDPDALKNKIRSLQEQIAPDHLIRRLQDADYSSPNREQKKKIDRTIEEFEKRKGEDRFELIKRLESMGPAIGPYLHEIKKAEQTGDRLRKTLQSVLKSLAWQHLENKYQPPNFLER